MGLGSLSQDDGWQCYPSELADGWCTAEQEGVEVAH